MHEQERRFIRYTVAFERMLATELRLLSDRVPDFADHLVELADKVEEHVDAASDLRL